jgi:hypothetical protein
MLKSRFFIWGIVTLFISMFSWSAMAQNCNLPAPTGLVVSFPTSTTARLDWNAIPGAWGYRVGLTNQNTAAVQFLEVQAPTTHIIVPVEPNTPYRATVQGKCDAFRNSPNVSMVTFGTPVYIIVVDLIPYSLSACNGDVVYTHQGPLPHNITNTTQFMTIPTLANFDFSVQYQGSELRGRMIRNSMNSVSFGLITQGWGIETLSSIASGTNDAVTIRNQQNPYETLVLSLNPDGRLYYTASGNGYSNFNLIQCRRSGGGGEPGLETSNTTASNALSSFQVAPNPFADELNIQMGEVPTEAFQIRLFNTAGQLCVSKDVSKEDAHTNNLALPTEGLAPGMYYLHLSTGNGETVVKKVVKM